MEEIQVKLTEFSNLIESYTADFVGRKWLLGDINHLLEDPGCRFVLLTGDAGTGKTALMAQLAKLNPQWLRYFIRRDSQEILSPSDGKTFFLTIGGQLATIKPSLFEPEKLKIVVSQRIGDVKAGGTAVGVRIDELKTSPFYEVSIQVEQEIKRVAGDATGLEIGRLVTENRLLSLQDLQYLGLLDPAWLLYQQVREERIVVLVDALDELRYSPSELDILEALSQLPVGYNDHGESDGVPPDQNLSGFPPNLRFIITSRREKFLDRLLARSDVRELPLDIKGDKNQNDLRTFVMANLPEQDLEPALVRENTAIEKFIENLLEKSAGNFLYLRSLLEAIREALEDSRKEERLISLLRVEDLPEDLDRLYGYFLDSLVDWIKRSGFGEGSWRRYLRPLLGVLAVAREPLKEDQLIAFTGLDSDDLGDLLRELRQFVKPLDGRQTYRIYHTSFAEYLLDAAKNQDYRIDAANMHGRIADIYLNLFGESWFDCDDSYAVRWTLFHIQMAFQKEKPTYPKLKNLELEKQVKRLECSREYHFMQVLDYLTSEDIDIPFVPDFIERKLKERWSSQIDSMGDQLKFDVTKTNKEIKDVLADTLFNIRLIPSEIEERLIKSVLLGVDQIYRQY